MEGKLLTKEEIFQVKDIITEEVFVEAWEGKVILKALSAKEKEAYEWVVYDSGQARKAGKGKALENTRARLVAACAVLENGERMFTYEEVKALGEKSAIAIEVLFKKAQQMNGMETKAVEEVVENLLEGRSENSTSD
jgi:hypothetical protein